MANSQLTIQISRTSVHVAEVLRSTQEIVREKSLEFEEKNPVAYKNQLADFFDKHNFKDTYDEYTMAWCSPQYSLMPMRIFNDTKPADVLNLLFGKDGYEGSPDFNRLAELNIVAVFEIPDWVKSFFIIKYPQIIFKHEHAMMLRALFQSSTYKLSVVVSLCDDYLNISVIHKNELQFSNSFEYQNAEDILYHLVFVLERRGIKEATGEIKFFFQNEPTKRMVDETTRLLNKHSLIANYKVAESENSIKLQTLCV